MWPSYEAAADVIVAEKGDASLAEAPTVPRRFLRRNDRGLGRPGICAVDADRFSTLGLAAQRPGGQQLVPDGGIGAFVQRRLVAGAINIGKTNLHELA